MTHGIHPTMGTLNLSSGVEIRMGGIQLDSVHKSQPYSIKYIYTSSNTTQGSAFSIFHSWDLVFRVQFLQPRGYYFNQVSGPRPNAILALTFVRHHNYKYTWRNQHSKRTSNQTVRAPQSSLMAGNTDRADLLATASGSRCQNQFGGPALPKLELSMSFSFPGGLTSFRYLWRSVPCWVCPLSWRGACNIFCFCRKLQTPCLQTVICIPKAFGTSVGT